MDFSFLPPHCRLSDDTRTLQAGDVFLCTKPNDVDRAQEALRRGAVLVLGQFTPCPEHPRIRSLEGDLDQILLSVIKKIYPKTPPLLAAVTGTNGKTSSAEFCRQLLEKNGVRTASIGTLGVLGAPDIDLPLSKLTTPSTLTLYQTLHRLASSGIQAVVMEASSHALHQGRLGDLKLQAAAFTGLSQDHLDYHGTLQNYFLSKQLLFSHHLEGRAIINLDNPFSPALLDQSHIYTYGWEGDLRILSIRPHPDHQRVDLSILGQPFEVDLPVLGQFQVENALAALGLAMTLKPEIPIARWISSFPSLKSPKGRLEHVGKTPKGGNIFIDFGHTPDALERVLKELRQSTLGRIGIVFGCGGNRDRGKRPLMGEVANRLADWIIVTDDNPRFENPGKIRGEILSTCPRGEEITPRLEAIRLAISALSSGDVVVISGKGHETGQIFGDTVEPFSDHEAVTTVLASI